MSENTAVNMSENSLHGDIIKIIIKSWAESSMFEMINNETRENLEGMLGVYIPEFVDQSLEWDFSPSLVDRGMVAGSVFFVDENDSERVINFSVSLAGEIKSEYGE